YLSNPLDTNVVITESMYQSHSNEQASLRTLKQKQRSYFALLLHSYCEAEARKYFDCMEQVKSI
ncbi:hypothetical protein, partial [Vibrio parahaemolyticus]